MAQLGHTVAGFTLRVYAHAMRRDDGDKERLRALVEGRDWALAPFPAPSRRRRIKTPKTTKSPQARGLRTMGAAGFEPVTSRV